MTDVSNQISLLLPRYAGIAFALFIAVCVFLYTAPGHAATIALQYLHTPRLAFMIDTNAARAFEIGDYYFENPAGPYRPDAAAKYFARTLSLDPTHPHAHHQLARIFFLRGNFDKALAEINVQIELHGESSISSYYVRGLILGYMGQPEQAEQDFRHYLSKRERNWGAYNDIAWIYFQLGNFEQMREEAVYGLRIAPNNPWLLTTYGVAEMNLGNKAAARDSFEAALSAIVTTTPEEWSRVNPGNDPAIAERGLEEMRRTIEKNIDLLITTS